MTPSVKRLNAPSDVAPAALRDAALSLMSHECSILHVVVVELALRGGTMRIAHNKPAAPLTLTGDAETRKGHRDAAEEAGELDDTAVAFEHADAALDPVVPLAQC